MDKVQRQHVVLVSLLCLKSALVLAYSFLHPLVVLRSQAAAASAASTLEESNSQSKDREEKAKKTNKWSKEKI
ncbi:MAG: hypothetical protein BYD32DRAFT_410987 [Podila humilis]|nr:MAG: hypothetical protein BYD32DRAFT_410987 [Podila humilis]